MSAFDVPEPRASVSRLLAAGAFILVVVGLCAWLIASQVAGGRGGQSRAATRLTAGAFEEESGIHISRVVLTGGGGIVDVRYRVADESKAAQLHNPSTRLRLVDPDTGRALSTPFHFHSGSTSFQEGIGYYELLVNTGGLLEPGENVSVVIGAARLDGVAVR